MAIITFIPSEKQIEVEAGTSVYDAAIRLGLPVASSCNAEATCGKCNVQIVSGEETLSAVSELELRLLKKEKKPLTDRISCLAKIQGDCSVTTRYW